MITIISAAKNLDFKTKSSFCQFTEPELLKYSSDLIERLRGLSTQDIRELFNINPQLASLNYKRFWEWHIPFNLENAKQAVFAFNGEVYHGLKSKTLSDDSLQYAQNQLRILSGLYGVLKPLDLIQPYRLEMGIPLEIDEHNTLYDFWNNKLEKIIAAAIENSEGEKVLINLASNEYFKSVKSIRQKYRVVDFEFAELRGGKCKTIVVYLKKARGMMARFAIENRINNSEELKSFNEEGYTFVDELSEQNRWVFVR